MPGGDSLNASQQGLGASRTRLHGHQRQAVGVVVLVGGFVVEVVLLVGGLVVLVELDVPTATIAGYIGHTLIHTSLWMTEPSRVTTRVVFRDLPV